MRIQAANRHPNGQAAHRSTAMAEAQTAIGPAEATCPTCDQRVSSVKYLEIEGKLRSHDADVERAAAARFAAKEASIRKEAAAAATAVLNAKIAKAEREKKAAEAKAKSAGIETKRLLDAQRKMMEQAT